jgi:hypothetical protein
MKKKEEVENLLEKINKKQIWDDVPTFCFTSDIDWASEDILELYFNNLENYKIKNTLFLTHDSKIINDKFYEKKIERNIHPNFLNGSSHGDTFKEVIENCIKFAPESYGFRSHRLFDVSDITHTLKNEYNFKYVSNLGTIMQNNIKPILHESGLIHLPIFFEDGTHLYNQLDFDFKKYINYFTSPGLKIISYHPVNFVINSPSIKFARNIKDNLTRDEFLNIKKEQIVKIKNYDLGIQKTVIDIIEFALTKNYPILSLNDIYKMIVD